MRSTFALSILTVAFLTFLQGCYTVVDLESSQPAEKTSTNEAYTDYYGNPWWWEPMPSPDPVPAPPPRPIPYPGPIGDPPNLPGGIIVVKPSKDPERPRPVDGGLPRNGGTPSSPTPIIITIPGVGVPSAGTGGSGKSGNPAPKGDIKSTTELKSPPVYKPIDRPNRNDSETPAPTNSGQENKSQQQVQQSAPQQSAPQQSAPANSGSDSQNNKDRRR
ncbi:MAG: hypothetical protein LWX56_11760 [Ignavibacteria bacterium]|nr:hypothetical protein [Ignavibacteria bacterium]